ncbi:MAG: hypothetical protein R3C15_18735 [Thermoleophilia bacterium]
MTDARAVRLGRIAALVRRELPRSPWAGTPPPGHWGRTNAAWVRVTRRPRARWDVVGQLRFRVAGGPPLLDDGAIARLGRRLARERISYPFVSLGPFRLDGSSPERSFLRGPGIFDVLREHHLGGTPPWIGGIQGRQLRLDDADWVERAVDDAARLVGAVDAPGLHLDLERIVGVGAPMGDYPGAVNRFVARLREALPDAFLSIVLPATASEVRSWKEPHRVDQVDGLVPLVDQLAILFYDTSLADRASFEAGLAEQVDHLARWRALSPRTQLLVALGTFVNEPSLRAYRDLGVEGIEAHFAALHRATLHHAEQVVDGSAVYAEWTTSRARWTRLRPFLT